MHKIISFFLFILSCQTLYSQEKKWSLMDCITYAEEHNVDVKSKKLDIESKKINLSEAKWAFAPNIVLKNNYSLSQGRVLDPTTYDFIENQTVQGNNTVITASIDLFDGFKKSNIFQREKLNFSSTLYSLEKVKYDLRLNITAYYLQVLLAYENIKNCEQILNSLKTQKEKVSDMFRIGKVTKADFSQVETQLANAETNLLKAKNELYIAKLNICRLIDFDNFKNFEAEPDDFEKPDDLPKLSEVIEAICFSPEIKKAKVLIEIRKRDVTIAKSQYYPIVTLNASLASSFSSARGKMIYNNDGTSYQKIYPFINQYRDNLSNFFTLSVNIPIFNRYATRKNVQRSKLALTQAEYLLRSAESNSKYEVNKAYLDLQNYWQIFNSTSKYLSSSIVALEEIEKKYLLGAATIVDYNTVLNQYIDASTKYSQAKYRYVYQTKIIKFYFGLIN